MSLPIHAFLREKLRDHNLAKVSALIGCRRQLLHSWVHEDRVPSLKHGEILCRLAAYLGVTLEIMVRGGDRTPKVLPTPVSDQDQAA